MLEFFVADNPDAYEKAKQLFTEYAADINIDLSFQKFDSELEAIEKMYGPPEGGIVLCKQDVRYMACVAIRKIDDRVCELKRMYVQPSLRNKGVGKKLLEEGIALAGNLGYKAIRLDTLNYMDAAIKLYSMAGFMKIEPYYHNPNSPLFSLKRAWNNFLKTTRVVEND